MGDDFRRVKAGDPLRIPARTYNAMLDAAEANIRNQGRPSNDMRDRTHDIRNIIWVQAGEEGIPARTPVCFGRTLNRGISNWEEAAENFRNPGVFEAKEISKQRWWDHRWALALDGAAPGQLSPCVLQGVVTAPVWFPGGDYRLSFADLSGTSGVGENGQAFDESGNGYLVAGVCGKARILARDENSWNGDENTHLCVLDMGEHRQETFTAEILDTVGILGANGKAFRWTYKIQQVVLDAGDPEDSQNSWVYSGDDSLTWNPTVAYNRYETLLARSFNQGSGEGGFINAATCMIAGAAEQCPPEWAIVPTIQAVPKGVVVTVHGERTVDGQPTFAFEAMNPFVMEKQYVPSGFQGGGGGEEEDQGGQEEGSAP